MLWRLAYLMVTTTFAVLRLVPTSDGDRHAARSARRRPGRPPTVRSIRVLVLRLVREVASTEVVYEFR